jgi:hypothetical protein
VADSSHGAWRFALLSHFPVDLVCYLRLKSPAG